MKKIIFIVAVCSTLISLSSFTHPANKENLNFALAFQIHNYSHTKTITHVQVGSNSYIVSIPPGGVSGVYGSPFCCTTVTVSVTCSTSWTGRIEFTQWGGYDQCSTAGTGGTHSFVCAGINPATSSDLSIFDDTHAC